MDSLLNDPIQSEIEDLRLELVTKARQAALRKLDRRERSSGDIKVFLKDQGFSQETISAAIQELIGKNYINDECYAKIVVREQALSGKGPTWIQMKLKQKGIAVERTRIESLIQELGETSELELAKKLVLRKYSEAKKNPAIARKAIQALLRRGFSYAIARAAIYASED